MNEYDESCQEKETFSSNNLENKADFNENGLKRGHDILSRKNQGKVAPLVLHRGHRQMFLHDRHPMLENSYESNTLDNLREVLYDSCLFTDKNARDISVNSSETNSIRSVVSSNTTSSSRRSYESNPDTMKNCQVISTNDKETKSLYTRNQRVLLPHGQQSDRNVSKGENREIKRIRSDSSQKETELNDSMDSSQSVQMVFRRLSSGAPRPQFFRRDVLSSQSISPNDSTASFAALTHPNRSDSSLTVACEILGDSTQFYSDKKSFSRDANESASSKEKKSGSGRALTLSRSGNSSPISNQQHQPRNISIEPLVLKSQDDENNITSKRNPSVESKASIKFPFHDRTLPLSILQQLPVLLCGIINGGDFDRLEHMASVFDKDCPVTFVTTAFSYQRLASKYYVNYYKATSYCCPDAIWHLRAVSQSESSRFYTIRSEFEFTGTRLHSNYMTSLHGHEKSHLVSNFIDKSKHSAEEVKKLQDMEMDAIRDGKVIEVNAKLSKLFIFSKEDRKLIHVSLKSHVSSFRVYDKPSLTV